MIGVDDWSYLRARPLPVRRPRGGLRVADLFSGCGGLTLGMMEAARRLELQLEIRLAIDGAEHIAATYARNFAPVHAPISDVRTFFDRRPGARLSSSERTMCRRVGALDILAAGPPCQGHSSLNNHTRGDDPKNELYDVVVRAVEVLAPETFIIENVPALERDARGTLDRALKRLEGLGYNTSTGIVCVADIGVPQLRKRHVLLGHVRVRPDVSLAVTNARVDEVRTVRWAIGDLARARRTGPLDTPSSMTPDNLRRARYLLKSDVYDLPNRLRPPCQRGHHKYKSMYGRLDWELPAQTITTGFGSPGQGRYLHPTEPRTLTPHEAARLQFLPDWLDLGVLPGRKVLAEAIGNAVPPKLAFVMATHLMECQSRRSSRAVSQTQAAAAGW